MTTASYDEALLVLADGARADMFRELLQAGRLPNIKRHVVDRGAFIPLTTVFASTSGPAYIPFLTGCFPGTADVPGIRWMDKRAYASRLPSRFRIRDYCTPELPYMNRDIPGWIKTAYDHAGNAINVFGCITRGVPRGNTLEPEVKDRLWHECHDSGEWREADEAVARVLVGSLTTPSRYRFAIFPGIDGTSHCTAPDSDGTLAAYARVDVAIGQVADELQRLGRYESTLIAIVSDHGHSSVHSHFDVGVFLDEEVGIPTLFGANGRRDPHAVVAVSGNSMAHVYLRRGGWRDACTEADLLGDDPDLVELLLAEEAVDVLLMRGQEPGTVVARSRRGRAVLSELEERLSYQVDGADPFGFPDLPQIMSFDEAFDLTWDSAYPDALLQAVQLFRSRRTGDIAVSATPGWDLRDRYEHPEHRSGHGAMHAEHMLTPFCLSHPLDVERGRSVDVFPTMMHLLGLPADLTGTDGKLLPLRDLPRQAIA